MIPAWLSTAQSLVGIREAPGAANNPTIIGWAKSLGAKVLGIAYIADSTAWCGLFVAHCMALNGIAPPLIAVRAKAWVTWGLASPPALGAIVVVERPGGGHVTMLDGITADGCFYRCCGGNQGDAVSETLIAEDRVIAIRWPRRIDNPKIALPIVKGGSISTNEA